MGNGPPGGRSLQLQVIDRFICIKQHILCTEMCSNIFFIGGYCFSVAVCAYTENLLSVYCKQKKLSTVNSQTVKSQPLELNLKVHMYNPVI